MKPFLVAYAVLLSGCLSFHPNTIPDPPFGAFRKLGDLDVRFVDTGGGDPDNPCCVHCCQPDGTLKSYEEMLAGMTAFMMKMRGLDEAAAAAAAPTATVVMGETPCSSIPG